LATFVRSVVGMVLLAILPAGQVYCALHELAHCHDIADHEDADCPDQCVICAYVYHVATVDQPDLPEIAQPAIGEVDVGDLPARLIPSDMELHLPRPPPIVQPV
jgi:hypothetical protein